MPNRVAQVGGLRGLGERTAIHHDLAEVVVLLVKNGDLAGGLDELNIHGNRVEIHHAAREATLRWPALPHVVLALSVERSCPWLQGNIDPSRSEVIEIFDIGGNPNSGQIRLAVRRFRRWRGEIRLSVRCSRNPRRGVMYPLRRERHRSRQKYKHSHFDSSLPLTTRCE